MNDLGPILSTHQGRIAAGGLIWYIVGIMFVGSVVAIGKALIAVDYTTLINVVLTGAFSALILLWAYSLYAQTLNVHQYGFVWKPFLRAPVTVKWSDVRSFNVESRQGRTKVALLRFPLHMKGQHTVISMTLADGKTVELSNDIDKVEDIRGYLANAGGSATPATSASAASPWG